MKTDSERAEVMSPAEHVNGAGVENGAERARKSGQRERQLKKVRWSGSGAVSGGYGTR